MAKRFDISVYAKILSVRKAYPFDFALLIMRFFTFSYTIGSVAMLTLAGFPFLQAGAVASVLAISVLILGPFVSRQIDRHGQSKVLPIACSVVVIGSFVIIADVLFDGPLALLYIGAVLMGFTPVPGALARTRWTYLIETDEDVASTVDLQSVYAYEGILDDLGFTLGPPISIAIAAVSVPVAGAVVSTVCYALGAIVLVRSKDSEPTLGWGVEERIDEAVQKKSAFTLSALVRIVFFMMLCVGAFFGIFDSATLALAQQTDETALASVYLTLSGVISMVGGFVFGMIRNAPSKAKLLIITSILVGVAYACMTFVDSMLSMFVIGLIASIFYAPFLISENAAIESAVPSTHLTEALTWVTTGANCGLAFGPTLAGFLIDGFGVTAAFSCGAFFAICIPIIVLVFRRIVYRDVR
ncbi:MAG: MFS transporter [Eggerthellaceae bacterium]|nr:MFS transporter [Eggerthellaceae bacterium]